MWDQPKVVSLEQYRRRRYAQDMKRERAIYLAGIIAEMNVPKPKEEQQDENRKDDPYVGKIE